MTVAAEGSRSKSVVIVCSVLLAVAALASLLISLQLGGGAAAPLILDPGVIVRFGLPTAKLVVNVGASLVVGALVLACFAIRPGSQQAAHALDVASIGAGLWTVGSLAAAFFSFVTAFGEAPTLSPQFGETLWYFLSSTELGQAWLATTIAAATLTISCLIVRNTTAVAFLAIVAAAALIPMSTQGHQGGTADHDAATTGIYLHILFAAVWLGGLLTLVVVRRGMSSEDESELIRRFSTLALVCFTVVGASGVLSAAIRLGDWEGVLTPYGALVLAKVVALVGLGALGVGWRRIVISRFPSAPKWLWLMVAAELLFMGIASGVAAAIARTPTPARPLNTDLPTPAEILTGAPLPPPPDLLSFLTLWNFDPVWILLCVAAVLFYVAGVRRLRMRGDGWPIHRTVLWISGIAVLFLITNGGVNVYQKYLFSAHMFGHMAIGMLVPILLVPAAPLTLALRTIRKRHDGTRGPREWLLLATHSKVFSLLTNPLVAAVLFVGSLWVFYYTPVFGWAVSNHLGHQWMIAHFLLTGYLFVQSLVGVDPSPHQFPFPFRLIILLGTMAVHAFFGLALISTTSLLLPDWYGSMGWETIDPLSDQRSAGAIAWSVGELPSLVLAISIATLWSKRDRRETQRYDRQAERDGGAELERYNAVLAARASRERRI